MEHESHNSAPKNGFTLIEMLVYIAVLGIIIAAVSVFIVWALSIYARINAEHNVRYNSQTAMRQINREVREAESIYTPTTTTDQLSVETEQNPPAGESRTFVDFFLCDTQLCVKREGASPMALTTEDVIVSAFEVQEVMTGTVPSVRISLGLEAKNPNNRQELDVSTRTRATISLRSY